MAGEITGSLALTVGNGDYQERFSASGIKVDQDTQAGSSGVVTVGTAVQTLSIGAVTEAGYSAFRNLNTQTSGTHYIAIGAYEGTNLHEFVRLNRNMSAVVPLKPSLTIGLKAVTSAECTSNARMQYLVLSR